MQKTLTYSSFLVASFVIIILFITSRNYSQLGFAVLLYPILAYATLKTFPRKTGKETVIAIPVPRMAPQTVQKANVASVAVTDIEKRAFLKIIGAAGISYFLFSLIGRRGEGSFFGRALGNGGTVSISDSGSNIIDPAKHHPTDGYKISEIDDNIITYYGFTNKDGAWLIMKEDTENNSFRYAKGDASFPISWSTRDRLDYDYFHNIF